jgi:sulfane dehydrogenase subunit SoxC
MHHPELDPPDRRRFLLGSAWATLTAWGGMVLGAMRTLTGQTPEAPKMSIPNADILAYGQPSRFANTLRKAAGPRTALADTPLMTPLQDLTGAITPSGLHFLMDHVDGFPDIDPQQHRLMIHGMVDRPLVYTMDELKRLPSVSKVYFLECNANSRPLRTAPNKESVQIIHGRTSSSEWTGVLLSVLLKEAGVQKGGNWIVAEGAEVNNYTMSIPMEKGLEDVLVAYAQNGEPVRPQHGFPLRLVIPGWEAIRSVKWLRRIKVTDQAYMAMQESGNNADVTDDGKAHWFRFALGPKSVITRPSGGHRLTAGFQEITGLAWTGGGYVKRVEVSTNGGKTWKDAELQQPVLRYAHTRFRFPWNWNGEEAELQSRCTDEKGEVQPTILQAAKVMGVTPEYFYRSDHCNFIQPWKVNHDGSVQNGLVV